MARNDIPDPKNLQVNTVAAEKQIIENCLNAIDKAGGEMKKYLNHPEHKIGESNLSLTYIDKAFSTAKGQLQAAQKNPDSKKRIELIDGALQDLHKAISEEKNGQDYQYQISEKQKEIKQLDQKIAQKEKEKPGFFSPFRKKRKEISSELSSLKTKRNLAFTDIENYNNFLNEDNERLEEQKKENEILKTDYSKLKEEYKTELTNTEEKIEELNKSKPFFLNFPARRKFNKEMNQLKINQNQLTQKIEDCDASINLKNSIQNKNLRKEKIEYKTKANILGDLESVIEKETKKMMASIEKSRNPEKAKSHVKNLDNSREKSKEKNTQAR